MKNNKIILLFQKLTEDFSKTPLCQHLGLALGDYKSIEFVSDKTLIANLTNYVAQLELDASFKMMDVEDDEYAPNEEF